MRTIAIACQLGFLFLGASAAAQVPDYLNRQLQARTNLPVNGPSFNLPSGSSFNSITVALNDNGEVAFKVQILPGSNAQGVWFGSNGVGAIVCQSENVVDVLLTDVTVDNTSRVVYSQTGGGNDGIYRCNPSVPTSSLITALPLGASGWGSPQTRDDGSIGYRASFAGGRAWAAFANGSANVYASEAGISPGSPYGFLFTPAYGSTGKIAGKVQILQAGAVPQHDQIQIHNGAGSIATLIVQQSVNPASPVSAFDNSVAINGFDQVAFIGNRVAGGRAVYRVQTGFAPIEIAATGVNGLTEIESFGPAMNDAGLIAFRGRDAQGQAVFISNGSALKKVISQGDLVSTDLGMAVIGQHDASPVFGGGVAINDDGDVAFTAGLHPVGNNQIEWGTGVFVAYAEFDRLFGNGFE